MQFFQAAVMSILQSAYEKSLMAIAQQCYELYWTSPGSNIPWKSSCTATYLPSLKPLKSDKQDMRGNCWKSKDKHISNVFLRTPSHGQAGVRRPARTYLHQLSTDTGCSLEDLPNGMDDRDKWQGRVREIHTSNTMWWWWWYIYIGAKY